MDVCSRRGFTITELLVVIGIIALLAGLLMVAMGRVRASSLKTATVSTMQSFGRACDAFRMEHDQYPGVIPEQVLAAAGGVATVLSQPPPPGTQTMRTETRLSSMENALLHLMGGYRVCPPGVSGCPGAGGSPSDTPIAEDYASYQETYELVIGEGSNAWHLKINIDDIGEGPVINGKVYAPYFTPGPREIAVVPGQLSQTDGVGMAPIDIPDLIDAWGQPILYTRRVRTSGPLVWIAGDPDVRPQFYMEGWLSYLDTQSLGERGVDQQTQSILFDTSDSPDTTGPNRFSTLANIIRHPSLGEWEGTSPLHDDNRGKVAPRGEYVLISAGPDHVYFSKHDGPGTPANPVDDIVTDPNNANPQMIESYDDIVLFGGG